MDLNEARAKIDEIDRQIVALFGVRMAVSRDVAAWKKQNGKPLTDAERERKKLVQVTGLAAEEFRGYTAELYELLFALSKAYQARVNAESGALSKRLRAAMEKTPVDFPEFAAVACQGVEGAYSQQACTRLFRVPNILYFKGFEGVFQAIESGLCRYGVLPIENSTAGSVNAVYDLLSRHQCSIVRSVRMKVEHSLLALPGVKKSDIKEIVSHEQAFRQCENYLKGFRNVTCTVCENTAAAARLVAESGRKDLAALSSASCAALYGLSEVEAAVQDRSVNYTRFICISRETEIYGGADKTSILVTLPHEPGALYRLLSRFYASGINLCKLESRPLPGREFEFLFYFDLEKPIASPGMLELLDELEALCSSFTYLGSYSELI